jgi:hypothetical protein
MSIEKYANTNNVKFIWYGNILYQESNKTKLVL